MPWTPLPKVKVQGARPDSNDPFVRRLAADALPATSRPVARITRTPETTREFFLYLNIELSQKKLQELHSRGIVRPLLTLPNPVPPHLAVRRCRRRRGASRQTSMPKTF